jgi:resuscitation-promoting factor RpfB
VRKSDAIQAAAAVDATPEPPQSPSPAQTAQTAVQTPAAGRVPAGGRTLTVSTTGYSLPGRASTGVPVGWGVVAVDPAVIPLGTRLSIPGYGEAVAADTGGAVRGDVIDLWFPTLAQARGWGRRTVTITLH